MSQNWIESLEAQVFCSKYVQLSCTPFSSYTKIGTVLFRRVGDLQVQERNLQEDPLRRLEVCRDTLHLVNNIFQ